MTDCPMCGAPQGQRCLTKSGKRRGRPHTARTTAQENTMSNEAIITDDMRSPDERVKIGWLRMLPSDEHRHLMREVPSGWTEIDRDYEPYLWPREGCPDVEFEPIRTLADDEVAVKRGVVKAAEALAAQKRDWVLRGCLLDALETDR